MRNGDYGRRTLKKRRQKLYGGAVVRSQFSILEGLCGGYCSIKTYLQRFNIYAGLCTRVVITGW